MKPENQKPKYSLAQNVVWMIKLAWKVRKRVLLFCVLAALVEVLYNLAQLYISFTNFTAGKKMQKDGMRFRSTKGDGHGFGLVRIDAIVERLEGYISRNSEDGAFTTEILLPQV